MESFGNFSDEEWHTLSRMFMGDEGSDLLAKQGLISSQCDFGFNFEIPNIFLTVSDESSNAESFVVDEEHLINVSDTINPNFYQFFSQENSISTSDASNDTIPHLYPYHESFPFCPSNIVSSLSNDVCDQSIESCMMNEFKNSSQPTQVLSHGSLYLTQDVTVEKGKMENSLVSNRETPLKRKVEIPDLPVDDEVNHQKTDTKPKKRSRVSRENKNKKNVQPNKSQKVDDTEEGNNNNSIGEMNGQSSSSCSSNDELNGSQELNGVLNAKTRASRGTATDPQSLYARKRRERINERLRILQTLVPNGTKVDISTMLEEAVGYVKFLKLQIQLLSSDDMWMYAPIAYNGMDMGLYQNMIPNL